VAKLGASQHSESMEPPTSQTPLRYCILSLAAGSLGLTSRSSHCSAEYTRSSIERHDVRDGIKVVMTTAHQQQVPAWRHTFLVVAYHLFHGGAVAAGAVQQVQVCSAQLHTIALPFTTDSLYQKSPACSALTLMVGWHEAVKISHRRFLEIVV